MLTNIASAKLAKVTAICALLMVCSASLAAHASPALATQGELLASTASTPAQTSRPAAPALAQRNPRYVIQKQDVLALNFPLSPEMDQSVTVQPDGFINLQNGSSLHVQGLTVPEVSEAIKGAYSGTLHNPIVIVDLKDFQKPFFTVSGQVGKPGQYDLRADITVAEAIAVAGGLAPTAKSQIFLFHRTSDAWFEVKKVNLSDVMKGKNMNEDSILKPGDMIFVPETKITTFRKYVPYSLNAGTYLTGGQF